ncbi:MAG: LamG-like jellyroll fold domain-containing protein [Akkermansia sp.]
MKLIQISTSLAYTSLILALLQTQGLSATLLTHFDMGETVVGETNRPANTAPNHSSDNLFTGGNWTSVKDTGATGAPGSDKYAYFSGSGSDVLYQGGHQNYTGGNMAFSLWFNADALPVNSSSDHPDWSTQWLYTSADKASNHGFKLGITAAGTISFSLTNLGGSGLQSSLGSIVAGEWNQMGVSLNGSLFTLYLNGVAVASKDWGTNTPSIDWGNFSRLAESSEHVVNNQKFQGGIDEIKIWNIDGDSQDTVNNLMKAEGSSVPEPTVATLSLFGLLGLFLHRRRN